MGVNQLEKMGLQYASGIERLESRLETATELKNVMVQDKQVLITKPKLHWPCSKKLENSF